MMDITKIGGKKGKKPPDATSEVYIGIYPEIKIISVRFASENRNVLKYSRYHTELRIIVEF
jgi:hypothetical protein